MNKPSLPKFDTWLQYLPLGIEPSRPGECLTAEAVLLVSLEKAEGSEVARHVARVAAQLFAAKGYDATSVREIVEAAGVTKPTLYYYFGSKEGLAQALLTVPLTGLLATIRAIVSGPGDAIEVLAGAVEAHFAFCRDDPDRARFYYALCFGPHASTALVEELFRFADEKDARLLDAVERLAGDGVVDASRVDQCARACRGLITMATIEFLYGGGDLGPDLAGRLVGDLLWGFGRTRPEAETRGSECPGSV
jgi:AcrR family transcriptional regulator